MQNTEPGKLRSFFSRIRLDELNEALSHMSPQDRQEITMTAGRVKSVGDLPVMLQQKLQLDEALSHMSPQDRQEIAMAAVTPAEDEEAHYERPRG
jgi:hypothetical protein